MARAPAAGARRRGPRGCSSRRSCCSSGGCPNHDRRHALRVARRAEAGLGADAEARWVAAAMLHDVGKYDAGLSVPARGLATIAVVGASGPRRVSDWAGGRGWRLRVARCTPGTGSSVPSRSAGPAGARRRRCGPPPTITPRRGRTCRSRTPWCRSSTRPTRSDRRSVEVLLGAGRLEAVVGDLSRDRERPGRDPGERVQERDGIDRAKHPTGMSDATMPKFADRHRHRLAVQVRSERVAEQRPPRARRSRRRSPRRSSRPPGCPRTGRAAGWERQERHEREVDEVPAAQACVDGGEPREEAVVREPEPAQHRERRRRS